MGWDFWDKVQNLEIRTSDPERIAKNAKAGFAFNQESFLDNELFRKASETGCLGHDDCGAGFACIDGKCTKIFTRNGGSWAPSSCGDDSVTWNCTKGEKSGRKDACSRPSPGNCEQDPVCPGERCCRQQLDGSIRCVCGSCEQTDYGSCNVYCDQSWKAWGNVYAGCHRSTSSGFGECGGNICDECSFCEADVFGTSTCQPGTQDDPFTPVPCHCASKCLEECHTCNKDTDSPSFGECVYSPDNCMECCTAYNYECSQCGRYFPGAETHCVPVGSSKTCNQALREKLAATCAADCESKGDPCAPTGSVTRCVDGSAPVDPYSNPAGPSGVSCPDGKVCSYTGFVEAGGKTCYFYNTWNAGEIPENCEACDCNCHDDCGSCEICNAQGQCVTDPDCDSVTYRLEYRWNGFSNTAYPEYDCRNKNDDSWKYSGYNNIPYSDISKYKVGTLTQQIDQFDNCGSCVPCQTCCVGQADPCNFMRVEFNGVKLGSNSGVGFGQATGVKMTCPFAGIGNVFTFNRTLEIRFIPE